MTCWKKVKYFHPEGKGMPNGSHYQRGGFIRECILNTNSFVIDETTHPTQNGTQKYRGGIIVLTTDANAVESDPTKALNIFNQVIASYKNRFKLRTVVHNAVNGFNANAGEHIGAYSVGKFFKGKYVGYQGEIYNDESLSIEISGLSCESLLHIAEMTAQRFQQDTVLVKDLNNNKIYTAYHTPRTKERS